MAIVFRPTNSASSEYNEENERRFRSELESYLLQLSVDVNGAITRSTVAASVSSTKEALLSPPIGLTIY